MCIEVCAITSLKFDVKMPAIVFWSKEMNINFVTGCTSKFTCAAIFQKSIICHSFGTSSKRDRMAVRVSLINMN